MIKEKKKKNSILIIFFLFNNLFIHSYIRLKTMKYDRLTKKII